MTYEQFKNKYYQDIMPNRHIDIRKGQALMNFLGDIWFAEYKRMSSKFAPNVDCFYNDNLIPAALCHLQNNWYKFYEDIKKVYYTTHLQTETTKNSEGEIIEMVLQTEVITCYYVNNNEINLLCDHFFVNVNDFRDKVILDKLISLGFSENIRLVTL